MDLRARTWIQLPRGLGTGIWLRVNLGCEHGYARGIAEPGVLKFFTRYLSEGDCFYDVGAHIGFYSLIAARIVGPLGFVVGFEPDPTNFRTLRENCSRNELDRIKTVQAAVWKENARVHFERGNDRSKMTGRVIGNVPEKPKSQILLCRAISLDSFCGSVRPPKFVKIDVEGGELNVLQGAKDLLQRCTPTLLVEVHRPGYLTPLSGTLAKLGYFERHISTQPNKTLVLYSREPQIAEAR